MTKLYPPKADRILIRSVNWIGDAVMTTPAMRAIRSTYPNAEITVVANPLVAELFTFHSLCDRVIVFDKKKDHRGFGGLLRFSRLLRSERFDLAILLQNAIEAAVMAWLAGVPRRIGYATDGRGLLLTDRTPATKQVKAKHHTEYYLSMLENFGISGGAKTLLLEVADEERSSASDLVGSSDYLVINPGAAYGSAKRWFPDRFSEVADRLAMDYKLKVVLTGGPGEVEIGNDIAAAMQTDCLNLVGKTTVRQLMAILENAKLVVTNDSGPMHVAAAFDTPLVAVFGPTDHTTTSPYSVKSRVVRQDIDCSPCLLRQCPTDHRCMKAVTAEEVILAASSLLEGER